MLIRSSQAAVFIFIAFTAIQTSFAQTAGADTFKAKCAMCHGDDGLGATAMGKALGIQSYKDPAVKKLSDAELVAIIKNGKNNKMPAFNGQITDAQIKNVVQHIRKLQK